LSKKMAYILADGSKSIGMGHLSRACLLASFFKTFMEFSTTIVMKPDRHAEQFIHNRKVKTLLLPRSQLAIPNILNFMQTRFDNLPALFVLDVLNPEDYQDVIRQLRRLGCLTVVVFDESEKTAIEADIVVNGNPHQLDYDHSHSPGCYLVGPKYFIMDSAYGSIEVTTPKRTIKNVLVTVGGTDQNGLLFPLMDAINQIRSEAHFKIVTSKASGYCKQLHSFLQGLSLSTEVLVDVSGLAPL